MIARKRKGQQLFYGADAGPEETPRLMSQLEFIKQLMLDGKKRTLPEICQVWQDRTGKGLLETSASAALRSLRRPVHGGYIVSRETVGTGLYAYQVRRRRVGE